MFKKINPIVLFALLALLLVVVVVLLRMDARRQQGSFLREIANADPEKTTSFVIIPKGMTDNAITIEKSGDQWMVGSHSKMHRANKEIIDRIFQMTNPLVPLQLIARDRDSLPKYELTYETGTRVKIYEGKSLRGEFVFGKMDFQSQMIQGQQRPKINTYVRLPKKDDVYTVEGYLGSAFPGDAAHFRDPNVIKANTAEIAKIKVEFNNQNYEIVKEGTAWLVNGVPGDSATMANYIRTIGMQRSTNFAEEDAEGKLTMPSHKLTIELTSGEPIAIAAYPADPNHMYFITSSLNRDAVFSGSKNNLFENIFQPIEYFFGLKEEE